MAYLEPLDPPERPSIPYRRIKRRSNRGLVTTLAAAVMLICAGGLWVAHKLGSPDGNADIPLLQAETDPVKVKPEDPGGMPTPNRDRSYVLDQDGPQPPEHLMPPPEAPLPRPAPSDTASATLGAGATGSSSLGLPVAPAAAAAERTPSQPPQSSPGAAIAAPSAAAPPAAPAPLPGAPATAEKPGQPTTRPAQTAAVPPAGSSARGYRLQIASVKTQDGAKEEWDRIRRQNSDILGSLPFISERVDLGDRGIFYRIQAGPIADAQDAERICTMLRQRNVGCILVKP